jgi:glycosyltransferase involved in cell wall biosynthesis
MDIPCYSLGIHGRSYEAFWLLFKLFRKHGVHLVHVNNLGPWPDALLASRLAGCPCIETFHGVEDIKLAFSPTKRLLYRAAGLLSARVTAVSQEAAELLVSLTGMGRSRVRLIPNGVNTDRFAPAESPAAKKQLRQEKGLPEGGLLVGCVAALRPVKNHFGLLEAFKRASGESMVRAFLVLVGDGPLFADMKELARDLGISEKVLFLGKRNDVDELLRCFDVFVLNSHTEGLSYAMLEAMASGLPVVATAVGAAVHILKNGREGFITPAGDTEALAHALTKLFHNPGSLQSMGLEARKTVQSQYGIETMLERYRALYQETLSRS